MEDIKQQDDDLKYRDKPQDDALAKKWNKRISHARGLWSKFHKRVRHNRETVAGFNWSAEPESKDFYQHRANLIHGTITAILPNVYARNPEISTIPLYNADNLKLFCKTIETVTNRMLEKAKLKARAKATVRSALTSSFGVTKVMYQRDMQVDPIIQSRINDTQENILKLENLILEIDDPQQRSEQEEKKLELEQVLAALNEDVEVTAAEGLVIDRVLTDNILIDPSVCEFWDYQDADWICQIIPMKKSEAEATYKLKLDSAKSYEDASEQKKGKKDGRIASGAAGVEEDKQIAILEIWDKTTQRVYTMAEGCNYWLREPYSPKKVGERWYPFFMLPFQVVDGQLIGPSLVDLTEKLQAEHNQARDRFNEHRDLCLPGWVATAEVSEKSIKRYADSKLGEITIIDTEGKPLNQVIQERNHPKIDPVVYDTNAVRTDWEQVTGMQDAARSTVVKPKTATEASIMQQSLSGRVSEFRDQVEDWLQDIAQYAAQILLMEMTKAQVERIMGPGETTVIQTPTGPMEVVEPSYDWPELTRDQVFEMIEMKIRAGTTGAPDKLEQQENWGKVLPLMQNLITQILQLEAQGADATPLENLLKETVKRFDERISIEEFLPKKPEGQPEQPQGIPPEQMEQAVMQAKEEGKQEGANDAKLQLDRERLDLEKREKEERLRMDSEKHYADLRTQGMKIGEGEDGEMSFTTDADELQERDMMLNETITNMQMTMQQMAEQSMAMQQQTAEIIAQGQAQLATLLENMQQQTVRAVTAPKRVVRDKDGRVAGVEVVEQV